VNKLLFAFLIKENKTGSGARALPQAHMYGSGASLRLECMGQALA